MQTNQPVRETMTKNPARALSLACAIALPLIAAQPAAACGSEPTLGEICTFGFNFCPQGFLPANGSLVSINQNQALFSLLGVYYGGDGRTTFGVPDLRGRAVVGTGQGAGLSNVNLGQMRGAEQATLSVNQMPNHTHATQYTSPSVTQPTVNVAVTAKLAGATAGTPAATLQLGDTGRAPIYVASSAAGNNVALAGVSATASGVALSGGGVAIAATGGNQPVATLPPELGLTVCIASQGIYPMRP